MTKTHGIHWEDGKKVVTHSGDGKCPICEAPYNPGMAAYGKLTRALLRTEAVLWQLDIDHAWGQLVQAKLPIVATIKDEQDLAVYHCISMLQAINCLLHHMNEHRSDATTTNRLRIWHEIRWQDFSYIVGIKGEFDGDVGWPGCDNKGVPIMLLFDGAMVKDMDEFIDAWETQYIPKAVYALESLYENSNLMRVQLNAQKVYEYAHLLPSPRAGCYLCRDD
jgi:hypothetical protein